MNTRTLEACARAQAVDWPKLQEDRAFSREDDVSRRDPLWTPEDIAEPEPWTLASFSDLVPHELA
jgi:hypothetical protein